MSNLSKKPKLSKFEKEESKSKNYLNTRVVFHSETLKNLYAREAVAEGLDRINKVILFRIKSQGEEEEEYYKLNITQIYDKVEEVTPDWLNEFNQKSSSED